MQYAGRFVLASSVVLFSCVVAFGQSTSTSVASSATVTAPSGGGCTANFGPLRGSLRAGPVAPYSAVIENTHTQTLADGTLISNKSQTQKTYRDSQGRTRIERTFCQIRGQEEGQYVEIRDPVAGYGYILDPNARVAHRYVLEVRQPDAASPTNAGSVAARLATAAPTAAPAALAAAPRPATANTAEIESLGTQTIDGLEVVGTRTTRTIPVGEVGNDRAFNTVHEMWMSPLLHVVVLSKNSDPRNGESTMQLTNIDLSEPSLSLFQPPADYTVADETERVTITAPLQRP